MAQLWLAEHPTETSCVHVGPLWVSALTADHCTKRLPWWDQRHELRGQFDSMTFSKIIVKVSSVGPVRLSTMGSWPGLWYWVCISSCGVALTFNQKVAGSSHNICPASVLEDIYCRNNLYCSSQDLKLRKTNDYFSPTAVCLAYSRGKKV